MTNKKQRPLHCSGMKTECKGDHLDVGRVEIDHSLFQRQAEKEDLLLSGWEHRKLLQQGHEIGRVDKHVNLSRRSIIYLIKLKNQRPLSSDIQYYPHKTLLPRFFESRRIKRDKCTYMTHRNLCVMR